MYNIGKTDIAILVTARNKSQEYIEAAVSKKFSRPVRVARAAIDYIFKDDYFLDLAYYELRSTYDDLGLLVPSTTVIFFKMQEAAHV